MEFATRPINPSDPGFMQTPVASVACIKVEEGQSRPFDDLLAAEEPLEIRLVYGADRVVKPVTVTMRTPGNDFELAVGFLFTEGILQSWSDVKLIRYCSDSGKRTENNNVVKVEMQPQVTVDVSGLERNFYTTSSCGVCGKSSMDSVRRFCAPSDASFSIKSEMITRLPELLKSNQVVFKRTGGLHAAALVSSEGQLLLVREDVGRHNALDKIIGAAFSSGQTPLNNHILVLSGRISFELVQKAAMAGIGAIVAVGAPSSLAVDLAKSLNLTLIGFVRDQHFNVYCGADRIIF